MKTSDFDYHLPPEFIAQMPIEPRDQSRLLVLDRSSGLIQHTFFYKIGDYLRPGDLLVLNETRVIPARLFAHKCTGGRVELLLLRKIDDITWEALVGGKGIKKRPRLTIENGPACEILAELDGARRLVRFYEPIEPHFDRVGHTPLPPYIHSQLKDPERYQTVYARNPGSAAAPTAGLHFTPSLIKALIAQGVRFTYITLHVGLDTFAPVKENDPSQHSIHTEWCELNNQNAEIINLTHQAGGRIIAVGTTSVRTLESAASQAANGLLVGTFSGPTDLFILPGYNFRAVDGLVTNFHLPRSTLIMLVSAFVGRERIMEAYETAKAKAYRFFSFGDAMLII